MEELDQRVQELEMRLSFQEDLLRQLDEVIRSQAAQIDHLGDMIKAVQAQAAQNPGQASSLEEDVPPHW